MYIINNLQFKVFEINPFKTINIYKLLGSVAFRNIFFRNVAFRNVAFRNHIVYFKNFLYFYNLSEIKNSEMQHSEMQRSEMQYIAYISSIIGIPFRYIRQFY